MEKDYPSQGTLVGEQATIGFDDPNNILGRQDVVKTDDELAYEQDNANRIRRSIETRENIHNHQCRFLEQLYGIKFGKSSESDMSCHIWQDISILTGEYQRPSQKVDEDDTRNQIGQAYSSQTAMGLSANEGKERRLMVLRNAIDYHHIKTSNEAYEFLNHEVTNEKTLIQYLKQIKRNLRSSVDGKVLGLSDVMVQKAIQQEKERDAQNTHYYDGDPSLPTTKEISAEEYEKLKIANIKKYKKV